MASAVSSPLPKKSAKARRPTCYNCYMYLGIKKTSCQHRPGSRYCSWYREVDQHWPGRFSWNDDAQAWEEAQGNWQEDLGYEATKENVEIALEILGLCEAQFKDFDEESLKAYYRKAAKNVHPDKTGGNGDDFVQATAAFEVLLKALHEKEDEQHGSPPSPVVLLAITAPPRRRRWKAGVLFAGERDATDLEDAGVLFVRKRRALDTEEAIVIRSLFEKAKTKASTGGRRRLRRLASPRLSTEAATLDLSEYNGTPWETSWRSRLATDAGCERAQPLTKRKRRMESGDES